MSLDQFDLILYDVCYMDAWLPPLFGKWTEDYKKASYSLWAVDEIRELIDKQIYPRSEAPIEEFCELIREFAIKMDQYSKVNPSTSLMFQSASEMAMYILDILKAMK